MLISKCKYNVLYHNDTYICSHNFKYLNKNNFKNNCVIFPFKYKYSL